MNLIRRTRGTPDSEEVAKFWALLKSLCNVGAAVGAAAHPALALLSIGAETIDQIQARVASRRSQEFVEDIADDLYLANKDGKLTVDQIQQVISSEQFNSALLQARFIATRTHRDEKLEALRNAVLNVAVTRTFSEDQQGIYLALVDSLQPPHLYLLKEMDKLHEKSLLREAVDDLKTHPGLVNFGPDGIQSLLEDLARANLIRIDNGIARQIHAFNERRTTPWGHDFIKFITAPEDKHGN